MYPHGRLVRGALVPVICDLPAARQISGFAGHSSSHLCSFCLLEADEIDNLDYSNWPTRTVEEHRTLAQAWLDAPNEKKRAELFDQSGIRWSELLRLPYWDPIKFLMIDSMHGFFLRLFQRHCRQIWGMDVSFDDGDFPSFDDEKLNQPSEADMHKAHHVLRNGSEDALRKLPLRTLRELTSTLENVPGGTMPHGYAKKALVRNLLKYRVLRGWFSENGDKLDCQIGEGMLGGENTSASTTQKQNDDPDKQQSADIDSGAQGPRSRKEPPTQEEVEAALNILVTGPKSKLRKIRKLVLIELCKAKEIALEEMACTVPSLLQLLEEWRIRSGVVDASGNLLKGESKRRSARKRGERVLGRETLKHVRDDIKNLQLPSWVAPAPSQPGVAKAGKFTADQWRTFCTYNLVFTLVRLWGPEIEGTQRRGMLDNFMHLVTAVKLGSMQTVTEDRISEYTEHMFQYLDTLRDVFKGTIFTTYQHLALHFPSLLRRFGPTHAWRCFIFERFNFLLQKIPTNAKFGELEKTMLKRFCMGQNLRALFKPEELPAEIHGLIELWEKTFDIDIRGTLRNDTFTFDAQYREQPETKTWKDSEEERLPTEWLSELRDWIRHHDPAADHTSLSPWAHVKTKVTRLGEVYQVEAKSPPDSHVYYRGKRDELTAGCIVGIFTHVRVRCDQEIKTETFFVLKQYMPLPEQLTKFDHYRRYPVVAGRLFQEYTYPEIVLINSEDILYHFGYGRVMLPEIGIPTMAAIPLDRS
ncbi:hypothetical protein NLJ89_g8745 [Agrocybe chaxingu]|uniref:DUF4218 domain-containing protein n=1 Tax=Agrocybe chaxingu TaxID=84603 RepID=A0A9W8JTU1_9AGAR|nr:hypothetical protein NLJ89_g8745 [Agrocybe chaxingu]